MELFVASQEKGIVPHDSSDEIEFEMLDDKSSEEENDDSLVIWEEREK